MCETSLYQLFLQGVGIAFIAILLGAILLILTDIFVVELTVEDDKEGGRK